MKKSRLKEIEENINRQIMLDNICYGISNPSLCEEIELFKEVVRLNEELKYLKMDSPEQNIEHFRIINENRRKINNLRAENKRLKEDIKEANENAEWWRNRYKALERNKEDERS